MISLNIFPIPSMVPITTLMEFVAGFDAPSTALSCAEIPVLPTTLFIPSIMSSLLKKDGYMVSSWSGTGRIIRSTPRI